VLRRDLNCTTCDVSEDSSSSVGTPELASLKLLPFYLYSLKKKKKMMGVLNDPFPLVQILDDLFLLQEFRVLAHEQTLTFFSLNTQRAGVRNSIRS
jgi:hypothetical protein